MINILLVEDDKALNESLNAYLSLRGHKVTSCFNGKEALEEFTNNKYDIILTDIMMPVMDGFSFLENVRRVDTKTPMIFMTAKDDKFSAMLGYKMGVDDYVVKPFDLDLLALKIDAILRRTEIVSNKILTVGNLQMNTEEYIAYIDGKDVGLSVREFDLLFKFLSYPRKTFTRSALMDEFWDFDSSATSRTVDVYMAKLRAKTADCDGFEIVTVHGLGYKAVLK